MGRAITYFFSAALVSAAGCVFGVLVTYFVQGERMALALMEAWVIRFNGILVGAAGLGLLLFVWQSGKSTIATLNSLLVIPDELVVEFARRMHRITSLKWAAMIVIPLSVIGGIVLWYAKFPLAGFARLYLTASVISVYVIASSILAFYTYTILLFRYVEDHSLYTKAKRPRFQLRCSFGSMDLQSIDSFFVVSATLGVLAIYLGFRGTLTANFVGTTELFRKLMILPILLYLPATLCYSLYPRWVLRQVSECDTLQLVDEFEEQTSLHKEKGFKANLALRAMILDVKEKILNDRRSVPLLSLKDAPSLTMSIVIVLQFIAQKDTVVSEFFDKVFK
ncbi:MAG TPA: hypothetical protein VF787_19360 [Thermoanaerobaculia bacterium]